jgi:hypothetical protein
VLKIDRLIKLPNDVLLNILERVGTLDAIKACFISKRTQNLPLMLSQIIIVLGDDWELHLNNSVVVEVTDKILSTRSPLIPLRKLKLRFIMRGDDHLRIGRSVALAMASQEIDVAEFEVMTKQFYYSWDKRDDHHYFAKQFNGFIGECPDAFAGLTRLHLQNLRFGQSDIPNMLSTCKRLQSLSFFQCDAGMRSVLRIEHARLVQLDIKYGQFLRVELDCLPMLQRISYNNWHYAICPLVLGFVPQLSELTLSCGYASDMTFRLSDLLVNVPSIENLHLDFQSQKVLTRLIFISFALFDG